MKLLGRHISLSVVLAMSVSCDNFMGPPELPAGTQKVENFNTSDGAMGLYRTAVVRFGPTVVEAALLGGVQSDELQTSALLGNTDLNTAEALSARSDALVLADAMQPFVNTFNLYTELQALRNQTRQAISVFTKYAPNTAPALRGELYAIQGYSVILLAELFCSGVPLSTVDFDQDYTYQPGLTTTQLYEHASALFDTALTFSPDSARVLNLARVGKGRTLLALGRYAEAAQAVAEVPMGFQYQQMLTWRRMALGTLTLVTMADQEGGNGLAYRTSRDPRTDTVFVATNNYGTRLFLPKKSFVMPTNAARPFVIADWIEARLIQAEASLHADDGDGWVTTINAMRTNGTFTIIPKTPPATGVDTVWALGTAKVEGQTVGVPPLHDPGTPEARIDSLFADRAFWLYLTAHRQGDLRRLIRQYQRDVTSVYPVGAHSGAGLQYGSAIAMSIPVSEFRNPFFLGCLSNDA